MVTVYAVGGPRVVIAAFVSSLALFVASSVTALCGCIIASVFCSYVNESMSAKENLLLFFCVIADY
jgi:hypothetical protein